MEVVNKYPTCNCGAEHHFFTCECGTHAFHISASKKLICAGCHNVFELSKVIAQIKQSQVH